MIYSGANIAHRFGKSRFGKIVDMPGQPMVLAQDIVNGFDRVGTSRRVQDEVSMKIMRAYAECDTVAQHILAL
jgi:hypothetical protein